MALLDSAINYVSSGVNNLIEAANPGTLDGTAAGNDLAQSQYNFRYTVFPNDLGMDYVGHYMVININVPTEGFKTNGLALRPLAGRYTNQFTPLNQVSKVDTLRYGGSVGGNRPAISIPRQTRRIAESIALFMPNGLVWAQGNKYDDISMVETAGKIGIGALDAAGFGGLSALVGSAIVGPDGSPSGAIGQGAQIMGAPINPAVEVMFSTTLLRKFDFEFLFAPRNEEESVNLRSIIRTIKFHGAPEINTGLGATWIPPAEFDITIFNKGVENTNLLRINTCVLVGIQIDYQGGNVFQAFRNGHPAAVRMILTFQEVEPIHKQRVLQGF